MLDHIRLILRHAAIGFGITAAFVALLLGFNTGNLFHLVTHTVEGPMVVIMLFVFGGITFGSAQVDYRIMNMGQDDDTTQGGSRQMSQMRGVIPVPIPKDRHR